MQKCPTCKQSSVVVDRLTGERECHNDRCELNVADLDIKDAEQTGAVIGHVIGIVLRWVFLVGAVALCLKYCL
jgi:hypothetical protein